MSNAITPWTGDLVEDFETAKKLIAQHPHVDLAALMVTAADHAAPHSARLAPTWASGFVDDAGLSRTVLQRIQDDVEEADDLRDRAAETLASLAPRS